MIGRISIWRHVLVAVVVAVCGGLAWFGLIGAPRPGERYAQWQVVITPGGGPALNVSETIDYDMANKQRHGARRLIPTDFGVPTNISASAVDAPSDVSTSSSGGDLDVKIGNPNTTVTGEHRYQLNYTLPNAQYEVGGRLSVDLTGNLDFPVTVLRGTLNGFELTDTACYVGGYGSDDQCELNEIGPGIFQAEINDLPAGEFVTIEGTLQSLVSPGDVTIDPPVVTEKKEEPDPLPTTVAVVATGALAGGAIFAWARRRGRNQVYAGGASDAASLPAPGTDAAPLPTQLVTDAQLGDMATTEFEPPRGIAPWEGAVALRERVDDVVVRGYISGLAGSQAIVLEKRGKKELTISAGPKLSSASADDQHWVHRLLAIENPFVTGTYDKAFARLISSTRLDLEDKVNRRGWWRRGGPGKNVFGPIIAVLLVVAAVVAMYSFESWSPAIQQIEFLTTPLSAVVFTGLLTAFIAYFAYRKLTPSRTATGSAIALKTESFRRFLHASEAQHVEWAWKHDLLREYSAWAVALDEAKAWSKALEVSSVPEHDASVGPLYTYSMASSFAQSMSSGGSTGGGFSGGGFAGGGGGGGGGGGW